MRNRKTLLILLLYLSITSIKAQQATVASGGDASGIGGSVAYSLGQVVYTTNSGSNGSVAQGIQQPYTIINIGVKNETNLTLTLSLFPNPTTDILNLNIPEIKSEILLYQLTDVLGKLITEKKITENSTQITMSSYVNAIYFLNITQNNQIIKTFKIIKN